jgi:hypothetical protein
MQNLNRDLTQHEIGAIIGYWRSGASFELIAALIDIPEYCIINIVNDYIKKQQRCREVRV